MTRRARHLARMRRAHPKRRSRRWWAGPSGFNVFATALLKRRLDGGFKASPLLKYMIGMDMARGRDVTVREWVDPKNGNRYVYVPGEAP